jgi:hypothetical protein
VVGIRSFVIVSLFPYHHWLQIMDESDYVRPKLIPNNIDLPIMRTCRVIRQRPRLTPRAIFVAGEIQKKTKFKEGKGNNKERSEGRKKTRSQSRNLPFHC